MYMHFIYCVCHMYYNNFTIILFVLCLGFAMYTACIVCVVCTYVCTACTECTVCTVYVHTVRFENK